MDETIVRKKYSKITKFLIRNQLQITTMESCTSGLVASLLTDTEGASAIFKGAFITYSNEAKIQQGVPKEIIDKFGVYSEETASAMAEAARRAYNASISIGITGTMGNIDPANNDSTPGEIFFAISYQDTTTSYSANIPYQESRYDYKLCVADLIADQLISMLT